MCTGEQPIHFANATLGAERHICAFFNSPEEEHRVLAPFIREGIERGEKVLGKTTGVPETVDPKKLAPRVNALWKSDLIDYVSDPA
jgi:hypothetical protein